MADDEHTQAALQAMTIVDLLNAAKYGPPPEIDLSSKVDIDSQFDENDCVSDNGDPYDDSDRVDPTNDDELVLDTDDGDEDNPTDLDQIIFGLRHSYVVTGQLKKSRRCVYTAYHRKSREAVVITVSRDDIDGMRHHNVPREIRILQRLRGSKHCVQLREWASLDAEHYVFVCDYVMACDPYTTIQENTYMATQYIKSALKGLRDMWSRGVVHRDISISNLLWDPLTGGVVFIDFEHAAFLRNEYFVDVGTGNYRAPEKVMCTEALAAVRECIENQQPPPPYKRLGYDEKSDMYSLGVIAWNLLVGWKARADKESSEMHAPAPHRLTHWIRKIKKKLASADRRGYALEPGLDFLVKILCGTISSRLTVNEALEHPFLTRAKPDTEFIAIHEYITRALEEDGQDDENDNEPDEQDDLTSEDDADEDSQEPDHTEADTKSDSTSEVDSAHDSHADEKDDGPRVVTTAHDDWGASDTEPDGDLQVEEIHE